MTDLKRMRLVCELRQIDVWAGTGIPLYRISQAERGALQLTECEDRLLRSFLRERWQLLERSAELQAGVSVEALANRAVPAPA